MKKIALSTSLAIALSSSVYAATSQQTEITQQSWNYLLTHSRTVDKLIPQLNFEHKDELVFFDMIYTQADQGEDVIPWTVKINNEDIGITKFQNNYFALGSQFLYLTYNEINAKSGGAGIIQGIKFSELGLVGNYPIFDYLSLTGAYIQKEQNKVTDTSFLSDKVNSDEALLLANFFGQRIVLKGGYSQNKKEDSSTTLLLNKYQYSDTLSISTDLKYFQAGDNKSSELVNKIEQLGDNRDYSLSLKNLKTDDKLVNDGLVSAIAKVKFHESQGIFDTKKDDKPSYMELAYSNSKEFSKSAVDGYRVKFLLNWGKGEWELSFSDNYAEDLEVLPVVGATIWRTGVKVHF